MNSDRWNYNVLWWSIYNLLKIIRKVKKEEKSSRIRKIKRDAIFGLLCNNDKNKIWYYIEKNFDVWLFQYKLQAKEVGLMEKVL